MHFRLKNFRMRALCTLIVILFLYTDPACPAPIPATDIKEPNESQRPCPPDDPGCPAPKPDTDIKEPSESQRLFSSNAQEGSSRLDGFLFSLVGGLVSGLVLLFGGVLIWKKCRSETYQNIPDRGEALLHPAQEESAVLSEVLSGCENLRDQMREKLFELRTKVEMVENEIWVNNDRIEEMERNITQSENRNARDETETYLREKQSLFNVQEQLDKRKEALQDHQLSIEKILQEVVRMIERMRR